MKTIRLTLRIAALVLAALSLNSCFVGKYMCNYALKPEPKSIERARELNAERYPGLQEWYDSLHEAGVFKDTSFVSRGGRLHAVYAPAADPQTAQGTAIVIHGWTDNHLSFMCLARMYRDSLNYNVFVPDLFYHGLSEGDHTQMGWFDRLDVENMIPMAHEIFGDDFMVLHGVSMGAATTMMVSGDPTPDYVKAFVEDCGYSSVWNQFANNLKTDFHLPTFPVLNSASYVCDKRYGWNFKEASSVDQLAKNTKPMLFIHGENDDFVPTPHVYQNYEATQGYKELWIAPGSAHARAFRDHPAEYTARVRAFLNKVQNQ
ncbi:MAG: alpha/beta hydrolase [Candidatus Cryptobacteroides sp.]